MNIAILHGYSAKNSGDGLLLEEAVTLIRTSICPDARITIVASYPETFNLDDVEFVRSRPTRFGFDTRYLAFLARLRRFDLVVAVGGGYLRFKTRNESFKTSMVHLPQLAAAAMLAKRSVYLPQSVGPSPRVFRPIVRRLGSKIDAFYVRDDRSMSEFAGAGFRRMPDMALLAPDKHSRESGAVDPIPVYSIRPVNGRISPDLHRLADLLSPYVGYIQSTGAGNDDTSAMRQIGCTSYLTRSELLDPHSPRRVVIAVRLHAALMAMNAGHYVIHLAYERKGFGAFSDLGLDNYVFNVRSFSPEKVAALARELLNEESVRAAYDAIVAKANSQFADDRAVLIRDIKLLLEQPA
ncbi:hypothetical protein BH09CHL1_BH09CHL1_11290 [soil metagenome]